MTELMANKAGSEGGPQEDFPNSDGPLSTPEFEDPESPETGAAWRGRDGAELIFAGVEHLHV